MTVTMRSRCGKRFWRSVLAGCAVLASAPALAASMQKVDQSQWLAGITGLPSYVNMYIYVPDAPAAKPPIVVVPHHCQGSASSTNSEITTLYRVADKTGFIVIIPEATGQNCWDAGSTRSLKHGGNGDTAAIVQMVKYVLSKYQGDASRVYTVGGSSGGIMTEALLGVYPDVFMGGVSLMGVPCGCWADSYHDVTGNPSDGTGQWSGPCAGGTVTKTAQQWGDLVRSYFPGYTGHRPRLQHWHGTADTTLNYKVMAEDVKEWTNVLGLASTPTATDTPKSGTTHQSWKNACGYTVYETFSLSGVGHAVPFDGAAIAAYFGLDQSGGQDPEAAACPGGNGSGGQGGGGGAGGTSVVADGGADASDGGRPADGPPASGGHSGSGGATEDAGDLQDSGAATGTGGTVSPGSGGATSSGGNSAGSGGATGSGGALASSGGSPMSGSGGRGTGGAEPKPGSGGQGPVTGSGGAAGGGPADSGGSTGCACRAGAGSGDADLATVLLLAAAAVLRRRRDRPAARAVGPPAAERFERF